MLFMRSTLVSVPIALLLASMTDARLTPRCSSSSSNNAHAARANEPFHASRYDKPNAGTPGALFAADSSLPIAQLANLVQKGGKRPLVSYRISDSNQEMSTIYGDWASFEDASAYYFRADMDVDCDGKDDGCSGNSDGQGMTDWGHLAAFAVPWIVIPSDFVYNSKYASEFPGNNIAAVICGGKMYYGIVGDTNGDKMTGEASWVLARTCFPNDGLNGNRGHDAADVTYIVFKKAKSPSALKAILTNVGEHYIHDYNLLRSMGDALVGKLSKNLGLVGR